MIRSLRIPAALLVIAGVVFLATWNPSLHGVERIRQTLLGYGPWAVLASTGLMILQSTIAPLPANVTIVANGLVFGPFWGGLLSWITILIGASLCFAVSKRFGKPLAARVAGRSLESAEKFFDRYGLAAMLAARIIPFIPFDAVSYVAGFAGVPYPRFVMATAVGVIPSIAIYSYIGSIATTGFWWITPAAIVLSLGGLWISARLLRKAWRSTVAPAPTAGPASATLRRPAS